MTRDELAQAVIAAGKVHRFLVRDTSIPTSLPDFKFIMEPEADGSGWTVFYAERLERIEERHFDTEHEAYDYLYTLIGSA